jgi:hypothetical protein
MERIKLSKEEKQVLLHVQSNGGEQPRNVTPIMFHFCLSTLKEKGLVEFLASLSGVVDARLTIKAQAYLEQNPKLKNPIDWKGIITLIMTAMTAIATTLALFVACSVSNV